MAKDVEDLLSALYDMLSDAFTLPLGSDRAVIDKDKALALLDEINAAMPGYLKEAKRIAEDEQQIIAKARREAETVKKNAEEQARRMVSESQVLGIAKQKASDIVGSAETRSRELHKATSEYVDNLLKRTEEAINSAMTEVRQSRAEFRAASKK